MRRFRLHDVLATGPLRRGRVALATSSAHRLPPVFADALREVDLPPLRHAEEAPQYDAVFAPVVIVDGRPLVGGEEWDHHLRAYGGTLMTGRRGERRWHDVVTLFDRRRPQRDEPLIRDSALQADGALAIAVLLFRDQAPIVIYA